MFSTILAYFCIFLDAQHRRYNIETADFAKIIYCVWVHKTRPIQRTHVYPIRPTNPPVSRQTSRIMAVNSSGRDDGNNNNCSGYRRTMVRNIEHHVFVPHKSSQTKWSTVNFFPGNKARRIYDGNGVQIGRYIKIRDNSQYYRFH